MQLASRRAAPAPRRAARGRRPPGPGVRSARPGRRAQAASSPVWPSRAPAGWPRRSRPRRRPSARSWSRHAATKNSSSGSAPTAARAAGVAHRLVRPARGRRRARAGRGVPEHQPPPAERRPGAAAAADAEHRRSARRIRSVPPRPAITRAMPVRHRADNPCAGAGRRARQPLEPRVRPSSIDAGVAREEAARTTSASISTARSTSVGAARCRPRRAACRVLAPATPLRIATRPAELLDLARIGGPSSAAMRVAPRSSSPLRSSREPAVRPRAAVEHASGAGRRPAEPRGALVRAGPRRRRRARRGSAACSSASRGRLVGPERRLRRGARPAAPRVVGAAAPRPERRARRGARRGGAQ